MHDDTSCMVLVCTGAATVADDTILSRTNATVVVVTTFIHG